MLDCEEGDVKNPELFELLSRPRGSLIGSLFDAAPVGVCLALDGSIAYANPALARMWGYEMPEHMHGVSIFTLSDPDSREIVQRMWRGRTGESLDPWVCELRGLRPSGKPFPYRSSSLSFTTSDGKKATFAYLEDLSDESPVGEHLRSCRDRLLEQLGE